MPIKLGLTQQVPHSKAKTLTAENAETIGTSSAVFEEPSDPTRTIPEIRENWLAYIHKREYEKSDDVDTQLYDGFFSPADKTAMNIIRETDPNNLAALDITFSDERIKPLLFRYRARHFPWTLDESEQLKWATIVVSFTKAKEEYIPIPPPL